MSRHRALHGLYTRSPASLARQNPQPAYVMPPPTHRRRSIQMLVSRAAMLPPRLLLVLLLVAAWRAEAQPSSPTSGNFPSNYFAKINPVVVPFLIALLCGFFLLGFLSVYILRCAEHAVAARSDAGSDGEGVSGDRRQKGLDGVVLETFPAMAYAKAKEMRIGKEAMECAVCLSEFSDDDILRLLPGCCHVFHVDCVDVWFESHVTCPVCRADLSYPVALSADSRAPETTTGDGNYAEEGEEAGVQNGGKDLEAGAGAPAAAVRRWQSEGNESAPGAPEDRYTLKLPEHVRRDILEAERLRRASSLTVPVGGGISWMKEDIRAGRISGRWEFLLRTFSVSRRPEVAPVPASSAWGKRLFPSSVSTGDGNVDYESGSDKKEEGKLSSEPVEERV